MSTASPDTWADVLGVATQRAASASEPYFETASLEQLLLVGRGTPAAVDVERHPVGRGIGCGLTQGTEEGWIEVGHARNRVVEDRHAVRDRTVGLAERAAVLAAKTRGAANEARRRPSTARTHRGRRGRRRAARASDGDRGDTDEHADGADPAIRAGGAARAGALVGHAVQSRQRGVASPYAVFDMPTICAGS